MLNETASEEKETLFSYLWVKMKNLDCLSSLSFHENSITKSVRPHFQPQMRWARANGPSLSPIKLTMSKKIESSQFLTVLEKPARCKSDNE